jgi:hypothetical protein
MSKLQKKLSALRRGHSALQKHEISKKIFTFVSHFGPPGDPDTDPLT